MQKKKNNNKQNKSNGIVYLRIKSGNHSYSGLCKREDF